MIYRDCVRVGRQIGDFVRGCVSDSDELGRKIGFTFRDQLVTFIRDDTVDLYAREEILSLEY